MTQLTLEFPNRPAMGAADFLVAEPNEQAWHAIQDWPNWRHFALVLVGDTGCGKTHLAHVWTERAKADWLDPTQLNVIAAAADRGEISAAVLEDIDRCAGIGSATFEEGLFHLLNAIQGANAHLLITARTAPARWPVSLPDLASRLRAVPVIKLSPPDDRLLASVMLKLMTDRQLRASPAVIEYLLPRMERSFDAANALVERIDRFTLSKGRAVTIPTVRQVLEDTGTDTED